MASKITKNILILTTFVVIFLVLIFFAFNGLKKYFAPKVLSAERAADRILNTVNTYFAQGKKATFSGKPTEESGLYKVKLSLNNNIQPFYLTKDGALLFFPGGTVDISKLKKTAKKEQPANKEQIPTAQKPVIELFIISLCPYGVGAERQILPIINNFADKVNFQIKFIVNVRGTSIDEVASLHGNNEVREDVRQAAIMRYYPDKLLAYIEKIKENSCLISCGALKLEDYWKKAAEELRMDTKKIESFAYGEEGMSLLRQNEADAEKYGVTASPTLIINGVKSKAIYQNMKVLKQAIFSAFMNPLDTCSNSTGGS